MVSRMSWYGIEASFVLLRKKSFIISQRRKIYNNTFVIFIKVLLIGTIVKYLRFRPIHSKLKGVPFGTPHYLVKYRFNNPLSAFACLASSLDASSNTSWASSNPASFALVATSWFLFKGFQPNTLYYLG